MKLTSEALQADQPIPDEYAFCVPHPDTHATFGKNLNPDLQWSDLPDGTRSLALICHDSDVPTDGTNVNQEGETVSADLPRTDFYHWVVANIPADSNGIARGEFSEGVTEGGKDDHEGPQGTIQGKNNYTDWFAGDEDMEGDYIGYDGPCPPWNDELVHNHHFTLYALDVDALELDEGFTGPDLEEAIEDHILDQASLTATYTLNPDLR